MRAHLVLVLIAIKTVSMSGQDGGMISSRVSVIPAHGNLENG